MIKYLTLLGTLFITAISCIKHNESDTPISYGTQVIILNEGNYMASNASMTGYDPQTKTANQELFSQMTGGESVMGDSPTSIYQYGNIGYISVSGSGKIYTFDPDELKILSIIKGLNSPRYMYAQNNKMWVTDLNNSVLTQIDLSTKEIVKQGQIESPAEMLIQFGDYLYSNLWSYNKKIIKIVPSTGEVIETIEVGVQPSAMAADRKNGKLWVICDGGGWESNPAGYENPSIIKIDISGTNMKIDKKYNLPRNGGFSYKIAIATDTYGNPTDDFVYFLNKDLYKMNRNSDNLPEEPFIKSNECNFYSLSVSENNEIYVSDARDYVNEGACYRYSSSGEYIDAFATGISPGYIYIHSDIK